MTENNNELVDLTPILKKTSFGTQFSARPEWEKQIPYGAFYFLKITEDGTIITKHVDNSFFYCLEYEFFDKYGRRLYSFQPCDKNLFEVQSDKCELFPMEEDLSLGVIVDNMKSLTWDEFYKKQLIEENIYKHMDILNIIRYMPSDRHLFCPQLGEVTVTIDESQPNPIIAHSVEDNRLFLTFAKDGRMFEGVGEPTLLPCNCTHLEYWHGWESWNIFLTLSDDYVKKTDGTFIRIPSDVKKRYALYGKLERFATKEEYDRHHYIFKTYEKALVSNGNTWIASEISHTEYGSDYPYFTTDGQSWKYAIPFNGNENKVGTKYSCD